MADFHIYVGATSPKASIGRPWLDLSVNKLKICTDLDPETWTIVGTGETPSDHKTSHQDTGTDEINVAGLSGLLADPQTPAAHNHTGVYEPADIDLTTIAGLTATSDNFMVAAASAWASRTPAQAKTALALVKGDVGLGSVDNTSDAAKPVSTATQTALDGKLATSAFSGLAKITVSTTEPSSPQVGDLWVDTN